jgi:hypothetical protein
MRLLVTIPCSGSELGAVRKQESITEREKRRESHHRHAVPGTNGSKWEGREGDLIVSFRTLCHEARDPFSVRCCDRWFYPHQKASSVCQRGPGVHGNVSGTPRVYQRDFPARTTDLRVRPSSVWRALRLAFAYSTARQIRKLRTCGVIPGTICLVSESHSDSH